MAKPRPEWMQEGMPDFDSDLEDLDHDPEDEFGSQNLGLGWGRVLWLSAGSKGKASLLIFSPNLTVTPSHVNVPVERVEDLALRDVGGAALQGGLVAAVSDELGVLGDDFAVGRDGQRLVRVADEDGRVVGAAHALAEGVAGPVLDVAVALVAHVLDAVADRVQHGEGVVVGGADGTLCRIVRKCFFLRGLGSGCDVGNLHRGHGPGHRWGLGTAKSAEAKHDDGGELHGEQDDG
ncbi:hypothetical protein PGQ11_005666 [Apiospora arundinis]|uniref:Uncharacterized protein n=1 Tax=Apiospora arundinis TaxID=335852 RepID=A0ABR2JD06_9PEZI